MARQGQKNKQPRRSQLGRRRTSPGAKAIAEPQAAAIQQQRFQSGWILIAIILIVLAFAIIMAVMKIIGTAPSIKAPALFRPLWISLGALGLILFACLNWIVFARRKKNGYQANLCITCGHALDLSKQAGTCPECGTEYTLKECESAWNNFYQGQQPLKQGG